MNLPVLRLKPNADRRLRSGHLWIYSNEVDTKATPLSTFNAGDQAIVESANGKTMGVVALNPQHLICARMVSRDTRYSLDKSLLVHRIKVALSLRESLCELPFYRLVNGEADLLPGIEIDRFADVFSVQLSTLAMESYKQAIVEALVQVCQARTIIWRNDLNNRDLEGLERQLELAYGDDDDAVEVIENGVRYVSPLLLKKRNPWHYDQRLNRARLADYVQGKRVLSLYAGVGEWALQAAVNGASQVVCLEHNTDLTDVLLANAEDNHVSELIECYQGDVLTGLDSLKATEERFDIILADPPDFIRRKKDFKTGEAGYRRLYEGAMRLLGKDGLFMVSTRSVFFSQEEMQNSLLASARHLDRNLQIIERQGQSYDVPSHPAIAETSYLKHFVCRILPNS